MVDGRKVLDFMAHWFLHNTHGNKTKTSCNCIVEVCFGSVGQGSAIRIRSRA
jgi:hypothetical protein